MHTSKHRSDNRFEGEGTSPKSKGDVCPFVSGTQKNILRTVTKNVESCPMIVLSLRLTLSLRWSKSRSRMEFHLWLSFLLYIL